ncbi:hypothetical protein D3C80_1351340 [compost metagenome]
MAQVAARLFEQLLDVAHGLFGLGPWITETHQLAVEIGTDLATHIHGVAGADRLAQVVVQGLVRVGVFGVEHADTSMSRHQRTSIRLAD